MKTFTCDNHKAVEIDSMEQAATIFALRKATAKFGKQARVGALRMDCWDENGRFAEFDAFIGYRPDPKRNEISGHNVRFIVHAKR
jgi:hypothetical protein